MGAFNKKSLVIVEQDISSLKKIAEDGAENQKTVRGFNRDASLINACNEKGFYRSEAENCSIVLPVSWQKNVLIR